MLSPQLSRTDWEWRSMISVLTLPTTSPEANVSDEQFDCRCKISIDLVYKLDWQRRWYQQRALHESRLFLDWLDREHPVISQWWYARRYRSREQAQRQSHHGQRSNSNGDLEIDIDILECLCSSLKRSNDGGYWSIRTISIFRQCGQSVVVVSPAEAKQIHLRKHCSVRPECREVSHWFAHASHYSFSWSQAWHWQIRCCFQSARENNLPWIITGIWSTCNKQICCCPSVKLFNVDWQ